MLIVQKCSCWYPKREHMLVTLPVGSHAILRLPQPDQIPQAASLVHAVSDGRESGESSAILDPTTKCDRMLTNTCIRPAAPRLYALPNFGVLYVFLYSDFKT